MILRYLLITLWYSLSGIRSSHVALEQQSISNTSVSKSFPEIRNAEHGFSPNLLHDNLTNNAERKIELVVDKGAVFVHKFEDIALDTKVFIKAPFWLKFDHKLNLFIVLPFLVKQNTLDEVFFYTEHEQIFTRYHVSFRVDEHDVPSFHDASLELSISSMAQTIAFVRILRWLEILEQYIPGYRFINCNPDDSFKLALHYGLNLPKYDVLRISFNNLLDSKLNEFLDILTSQHFFPIKGFRLLLKRANFVSASYNPLNAFDSTSSNKTILAVNNELLLITSPQRKRRNAPFFLMQNVFSQNSAAQDCSSNKAPVAMQSEIVLTLKMNHFSHVVLNDSLFIDFEQGNSRRLKLQLKWSSGKAITKSDWLQYSSALQFIYAWTTYEVLIQQPVAGYSFVLTAYDKCNATTSLTLNLKIANIPSHPPCYHFVLIIESEMDVRTPFVHTLVDLVNIVSKYFNDTKLERILITEFKNVLKPNLFSLSFSDQSVNCNPCDITSADTLLDKTTSPTFRKGFAPNFKLLGATVDSRLCGKNYPPIILNQVPIIFISQYNTAVYTLPLDTFFDMDDGFTIALKTDISMKFPNDAVLFAKDGLHLYFYQLAHTTQTTLVQFVIQAMDSSNNKVSMDFNVILNNIIFAAYAYFEFQFTSYYDLSVTNGEIALNILQKITQHFKGMVNMTQLIVLNFKRTGIYPQMVEMRWTNEAFVLNKNPMYLFQRMRDSLFNAGKIIPIELLMLLSPFVSTMSGTYYNNFPINSLKPTPTVTNPFKTSINTMPLSKAVVFTSIKPSVHNIKPTSAITEDKGPTALFKIGPFFATFCDFLVYPIPGNLFFDATDGDTRNLNLTLKTASHGPITKESWLQLDADVQVLYGFLKVSDFVNAGGKQIFYNLGAMNSKGQKTYLKFAITLPEKIPEVFYTVTLTVSPFYDLSAPDINEQLLLLLKISTYFGEAKFSWVNILNFSRNLKENTVTFAWTNCTLTGTNKCPLNAVQSLSSKIVHENGIANSNFARYLAPQYVIKHIESSINTNCPTATSTRLTTPIIITKPLVVYRIPTLSVTTTSYFMYKVPFNTFYDSNDGYTPYLTLSLVNTDGSEIPSDSWIQFNKAAQEIYTSLYVDVLNGASKKIFTFTLIATNSYKRSSSLVIMIEGTREIVPLCGLKVQLVGLDYFSSVIHNLQVFTIILQKYNLYMGARHDMEVESFQRSLNNVFNVTFIYNRYSPSQYNSSSVLELKEKLMNNGNVSSLLVKMFLPEVEITGVNTIQFGSCQIGTSTSALKPTPNPHPPVSLNQVPVLVPALYGKFSYQIPENTFYDSTQGLTRDLKLELFNIDGSVLQKSSWIEFDGPKQTIDAVILQNVLDSRETHFKLVATNKFGLTASQNITITLPINIPVTHSFALSFVVSTVIDNMLIDNMSAFVDNLYPIRVLKFTKEQSGLMSFAWSFKLKSNDCNKSEIEKVRSLFFLTGNQMRSSFIQAMFPQISIGQLTFVNLCTMSRTSSVLVTPTVFPTQKSRNPNLPPTVLKLIPHLYVNTCTKFVYSLPEDTFFDVEDGLTRNLQVQILDTANKALSNNSWLTFNSSSQQFTGVITLDELNATQTYNIVATDKGGKSASQTMKISFQDTTGQKPDLIIESIGSIFGMVESGELRLLINDRLNHYVANSESTWTGIKLHSILVQGLSIKKVRIQWSVCGFTCNDQMLKKLLNLLMINNNLRVEFVTLMKPSIIITEISIVNPETCAVDSEVNSKLTSSIMLKPTPSVNTSPIIYQVIPVLTVTKCKIFQYRIPEKTCYDAEEGFTSKLQIKILFTNNTEIGHYYWLHLNPLTQKMYGILKETDIKDAVNNIFTFIFVCIDKGGQSATQRVQIVFHETIKQPPYAIRIQSYVKTTHYNSHAEVQLLWMKKLSQYFNEDLSDHIQIKAFEKSTVLYPQMFISWYNCSVVNPCSSEAEQMESKLFSQSNLNSAFIRSMIPEFVLISGQMQVDKLCVMSSSSAIKALTSSIVSNPNKVPIALIARIIIETRPCSNIVYQVPSDTFFDHEDGYTSNLRLHMTTALGKELPPMSYIKFNSTTQTIFGIFVYDDFISNKEFLLTATDSKGGSAQSIVEIKLQEIVSGISHAFVANAFIYSPEQDFVTLLMTFKTKLLSFYGDNGETIFIQSAKIQNNRIDIKWTNCTLMSNCNTREIMKVKEKILFFDTIINAEFIASLAPAFVVTYLELFNQNMCTSQVASTSLVVISMHTSSSSIIVQPTLMPTPVQNTPPVVLQPLKFVIIELCSSFSYRIPHKTFFDSEDGNTRMLKLELLTFNEQPLPKSSWIQFVRSTQVVYGHPRVEDFGQRTKYLNFILKATDSRGLFVTTVFTIVLPAKLSVRFLITIKVSRFFDVQTPDLTRQLFLVSKICAFVGDLDVSRVQVVSFERADNSVTLSWTNCTHNNLCGKGEVKTLTDRFVSNGQPNAEFQNFLAPYYTLLEARSDIFTTCTFNTVVMPSMKSSNTLTPYLTFGFSPSAIEASMLTVSTTSIRGNQPPRVNYVVSPLTATLCNSFAYNVPKDLFTDEDGMASVLVLILLNKNGSSLSQLSWIQFNSKLQTIYGMVKTVDIDQQPAEGYKYQLKATDSSGLTATSLISIQKILDYGAIGFYIEMEIKCSYVIDNPLVNDLFQLINKIASYFKDKNSNTIKSIDLTEIPGDPGMIKFTWTNCTLDFTFCPVEQISLIEDKIFNGNGDPKEDFKNSLTPQYELVSLKLVRQHPCGPTPTPKPNDVPIINKFIPPQFVPTCFYLLFKVPEDTFLDYQDGNTRNLHLSLKFINNSNIPTSYWLQFNETSQTIHGTPVQASGEVQLYFFKLTATDKDNNEVFMNIRIDLAKDERKILQNLTLDLALNFRLGLTDKQIKFLLVNRIASFYGNKNVHYVKVLHYQADNMFVSMTWTNCSLNVQNSCDKELAKQIQDHVMDVKGKCRTQFSFMFSPEFTVRKLLVDTDVSCTNISTSLAPTNSAPSTSYFLTTSSSVLPTIPRTVFALQNVSILVGFCGSINFTIPRSYFYDSHNSNRDPLQYQLLYTDGVKVDCKSWIQLIDNQFYGMAIRSALNSPTNYILKARNKLGSNANTNIQLDIKHSISNVTYKIAFSFLTTLNKSVCDSDVLRIMNKKLVEFFGDKTDGNISLMFFSRGDFSTRSYIMWTNCSLRTDICDYKRINQLSNMIYEGNSSAPNQRLIQFMQPEFFDLSVLDQKLGRCSVNKVLAVVKSPDVICATPCGVFVHKIPNNTFSNPQGELIENLVVELVHADGSPLREDTWITFDRNIYSLEGMVTEKVITEEPASGYSYLLTAYDFSGATAQTVIIIKICGDKPKYDNSVTLQFQCDKIPTNLIESVSHTLTSISNKHFGGNLNSMFLISFNVSNNTLSFTWANCSGKSIVLTSKQLSQHSNSNCTPLRTTFHDNKDYPPAANVPNIRLRVSFCNSNVYNVSENTFYDKEDKMLDIYLLYVNGSKVNDDAWLAFVQSEMKIYIIPTNKTKTPMVHKYFLVAKDSANQTVAIPLFVEIFESFKPVNFLVKVTFKSYINAPVVIKIVTFLKKLERFMNSNSTLTVSSYHHFSSNNTISLEFGNCTLATEICDRSSIKNVTDKLLDQGGRINADLFALMFPECVLEGIITKFESTCLYTPNAPPKVRQSIPAITVPACRYLKYRIPFHTFYDKEDGFTGNLSLKLFAPNNCWLEFDASNQTLFAFATDDAVSNQPKNGYIFILQATDTQGEAVNTSLNLLFQSFHQTSFKLVLVFEMTQSFQSSCMQEKIFIHDKLSKYYKDNTSLSIQSYRKGSDNLFVEVVVINCTMRFSPCEYITIDRMLSPLQDEFGSIIPRFKSFMLPELIARYLSKHKDPPCLDSSNKSPIQNNTFTFSTVTPCLHAEYKLPSNLIYDEEDGGIENLKVTLFNATNGFDIHNDSWIFLDQSTKTLFAVVTPEAATNQPANGYKFLLVAEDSRNAKFTLNFTVHVEKRNKTESFVIYQKLHIPNQFNSIPQFLVQWKNQTEKFVNHYVEILSYGFEAKNRLGVNWTICEKPSAHCNFKLINIIQDLYANKSLDFELTKLSKCLQEPQNRTIKTTNHTLYVNPCKKLHLKIPGIFFNASTSNLTVMVKQVYPTEGANFLYFDTKLQVISGVIIQHFFDQHGQVIYEATAMDAYGIVSIVNITLTIDSSYQRQYEFVANVLYFSQTKDVKPFLDEFYNKTSTYLNSSLIIKEVNMSQVNTINVTFDVSFTPCSLTGRICSKVEYNRLQAMVLSITGNPNFAYISALQNTITLQGIKIDDLDVCAGSGPKIGLQVGPLKTKICQNLVYKLPEESFIDPEQGTASNLSITLENTENFKDWIHFDIGSLTISVKPTLRQLMQQPNGGYNLTFTATDNDGYSVSQNVNITIEDSFDRFNFFVELELQLLNFNSTNMFNTVRYFESRFDTLLSSEVPDIQIINMSNVNQSYLLVAVSDCSLSPEYCDIYKNERLYRAFVTSDENLKPRVTQALLPEFLLVRAHAVNQSKCKGVIRDKPYITQNITRLSLTLCQQLQHRLADKLFMDLKDGELTGKSITLYTLNGKPLPKDSPIQYAQDTRIIYGYITQEQLSQYQSSQLLYLMKAVNSDNHSVDAIVYISLPKPMQNNYILNVSSQIYIDFSLTDLDIMINFLNRLHGYFEDSLRDMISIIEFRRSGTFPQKIQITWTNCSMINSCNNTTLEYLKSKIFDKIIEYNPYYIEALGSNFGFIDAVTKASKERMCLYPNNTSPEALRNLVLNISFCGKFEYTLANDTFIDKEDGNIFDLAIYFNFPNDDLIPNTYWLQYNDTSKMLYGIPDDNALQTERSEYILEAFDKVGRAARLNVTVFLNRFGENTIRHEHEIIVNSTCNRTSVNQVIIKNVIDAMQLVATQLNINLFNLHLKQYYISSDYRTLSVDFTVCRHIDISNASQALNKTVDGCIVTDVAINDGSIATAAPQPERPVVVNSIPTIIFTCGKPLWYTIPENTFFDWQDGSTSKLKLEVLDQNFASLNKSYVYFLQKNQTLIFFVSYNDCDNVDKTQVLVVKASDKDNNSIADSVLLEKHQELISCCIYISVFLQNNSRVLYNNLFMYEFFESLKMIYTDSNDELRIVKTAKINNTVIAIDFTNKTITNGTCNNKTTNILLGPVFSIENATTRKSFTNAFTFSTLVNSTVNQGCNNSIPVVTIAPFVPPNVGALTAPEDWFIYLLPLFILAFMLFMTCIFFYMCRYCYKCCIAPKTTKRYFVDDDFDNPDAIASVYASIPRDSPEEIGQDVAPRNWDAPSPVDQPEAAPLRASKLRRVSTIITPLEVANAEAGQTLSEIFAEFDRENSKAPISEPLSLEDMYAKPIRSTKIKQRSNRTDRIRQRLEVTSPVKTSYTVQYDSADRVPLSRSKTTESSNRMSLPNSRSDAVEYRVIRRKHLRLPTIPKGPPPPYSPPRKARILRQHFIPTYYERYVKPRRLPKAIIKEPMIVRKAPVTVISPSKPRRRKIMSIPTLRRHKRTKVVKKRPIPVIEISDTDSTDYISDTLSLQSESSIEVEAVLKGKSNAIRKMLRKNPVVHKSQKQTNKVILKESPWKSKKAKARHLPEIDPENILIARRAPRKRFKKPFLYDYIPVRRKYAERLSETKPRSKDVRDILDTDEDDDDKVYHATQTVRPTLDELLGETDEKHTKRRNLPMTRHRKLLEKKNLDRENKRIRMEDFQV